MIELENEKTLWQSKNKRLLLTTHRMREMHKGIFGSTIKSILLEDITACELVTTRESSYLKKAFLYFASINVAVYLINQFFLNAELIKLFFGELHIGGLEAAIIFYLSVIIAAVYLILFVVSVKKSFIFHAPGMLLKFQLRWLDFEEKESFISKVEQAKCNRIEFLYGRK